MDTSIDQSDKHSQDKHLLPDRPPDDAKNMDAPIQTQSDDVAGGISHPQTEIVCDPSSESPLVAALRSELHMVTDMNEAVVESMAVDRENNPEVLIKTPSPVDSEQRENDMKQEMVTADVNEDSESYLSSDDEGQDIIPYPNVSQDLSLLELTSQFVTEDLTESNNVCLNQDVAGQVSYGDISPLSGVSSTVKAEDLSKDSSEKSKMGDSYPSPNAHSQESKLDLFVSNLPTPPTSATTNVEDKKSISDPLRMVGTDLNLVMNSDSSVPKIFMCGEFLPLLDGDTKEQCKQLEDMQRQQVEVNDVATSPKAKQESVPRLAIETTEMEDLSPDDGVVLPSKMAKKEPEIIRDNISNGNDEELRTSPNSRLTKKQKKSKRIRESFKKRGIKTRKDLESQITSVGRSKVTNTGVSSSNHGPVEVIIPKLPTSQPPLSRPSVFTTDPVKPKPEIPQQLSEITPVVIDLQPRRSKVKQNALASQLSSSETITKRKKERLPGKHEKIGASISSPSPKRNKSQTFKTSEGGVCLSTSSVVEIDLATKGKGM